MLFLLFVLCFTGLSYADGLVLTETGCNLGDVFQNSSADCTVHGKNMGSTRLLIEQIGLSSSNLDVTPSTLSALSGEAIDFHIVLDTGRYVGDISRLVTIFTSDIHEPTQAVTINATVIPKLSCDTQIINFGTVTPQNSHREILHFINNAGEALVITDATCSLEALTVSAQSNPAKTEWDVTVTWNGGRALSLLGTLQITTDYYGYTNFEIPVIGTVDTLVKTSCNRIDFGSVPIDKSLSKRVRIQSATDTFSVTSPISSLDDFSCDLQNLGESGYDITVLGTAHHKGDIRGTVTFSTGVRREESISIPISYIGQ